MTCVNCGKLACYQFDEPCPLGHPDVWELNARDPRIACSEECYYTALESSTARMNLLTPQNIKIAQELLQCAESWEPQARLLGNVTAEEIAALCRCLLSKKGIK